MPSFLNDLDRIATYGYEPSDDDVVRARLRTLGIQEYRIKFDKRKLHLLVCTHLTSLQVLFSPQNLVENGQSTMSAVPEPW